jgi:hypothetical protein
MNERKNRNEMKLALVAANKSFTTRKAFRMAIFDGIRGVG